MSKKRRPLRASEHAWVNRYCPAKRNPNRLSKLDFVRFRRWYTDGVSYLFGRPKNTERGVKTWTRS